MFRYLYIALVLCFYNGFSQLVLNNGVIVNMNGGATMATAATMVLNNPPATPISRLGTTTSQGIKLETEWSRLQYNLSTGTTTLTVPYISNTTGTWVPFPLTVRNITAGTNAGAQPGGIRFSSVKTSGGIGAGYDNNTYKPSQVLNVCNPNLGACPGSNNSANVIDRFWVIEPVYYSTRPAVTLDFTYLMMETDVNGGNAAGLAGMLQPQRFDTTAANNNSSPIWGWNGFPANSAQQGVNTPAGSITGTSVGTCTNVQVPAAQFFPDWTLSSYMQPLPIQLIDYSGTCTNNGVTLKWSSASESNSDHYTVEKSSDGINFVPLANIPAATNSNQVLNYTYVDVTPGENPTMYYRLSETDKNGAKEIFKTILVTGCHTDDNENGAIYSYGTEVNINLYSLSQQNITVTGYDITGRLILKDQVFVKEGSNHFKFSPNLAQGVYVFEVVTNRISLVKRLLIEN